MLTHYVTLCFFEVVVNTAEEVCKHYLLDTLIYSMLSNTHIF